MKFTIGELDGIKNLGYSWWYHGFKIKHIESLSSESPMRVGVNGTYCICDVDETLHPFFYTERNNLNTFKSNSSVVLMGAIDIYLKQEQVLFELHHCKAKHGIELDI